MPAPKGNKNALGNKGGGRKPLYKPEYAKMARKIALLGATEVELARIFDVSESTITHWKTDHVEFLTALKEGRELADANVADRLYQRAMGYSHKAVKIFNDGGKPMKVEYTEHYPPDTGACAFWLKNRQKEKWRDKQEHEHSGPDKGPIPHEDVSAQEALLERIEAIAARTGTGSPPSKLN